MHEQHKDQSDIDRVDQNVDDMETERVHSAEINVEPICHKREASEPAEVHGVGQRFDVLRLGIPNELQIVEEKLSPKPLA